MAIQYHVDEDLIVISCDVEDCRQSYSEACVKGDTKNATRDRFHELHGTETRNQDGRVFDICPHHAAIEKRAKDVRSFEDIAARISRWKKTQAIEQRVLSFSKRKDRPCQSL